ncbi:MAG: LacI family DNA-binding transcriptional regulator [Fimbriimonas sp.]
MARQDTKRNIIGIAASEPGRGRFDHWFALAAWQGLAVAAEELGQDLLYLGRPSPDRLLKDGSGFISCNIDGLVFIAPQRDAPALRLLHEQGMPFVTISGDTELEYLTFGSDNQGGVRQALGFLRQLGHTRIAHVAGPSSLVDGVVREGAYRAYMAEKGLEVPENYVQKGAFIFDGGFSAAQSLLRMPYRPTAIFAGNDPMAYGVIAAAHDLKIRIPSELSVIGFDDEDHAAMYRPPLTTVRQPVREVARTALAALVNIIDGGAPEAGRMLPTELIVRESTAPVPSY